MWLNFMRGDFDSAVFYAMKAVEVRVREVSGLTDDLVGTALMRRAFDPERGSLTDDGQSAEKEKRGRRCLLVQFARIRIRSLIGKSTLRIRRALSNL